MRGKKSWISYERRIERRKGLADNERERRGKGKKVAQRRIKVSGLKRGKR